MLSFLSFYYEVEADWVYVLGSCDQHHVRSESAGTVLRGRKSSKTLGGWDIFVFLSILELFLWLSRSAPFITLTLSPCALHTSPPLSWLEESRPCCWICKKVSDGSQCSLQPLCFSQAFRHSRRRWIIHKHVAIKIKLIFASYAMNQGTAVGAAEKKRDSVKNTADKFIRTHRKANPINLLPNCGLLLDRKRKGRERITAAVRTLSRKENYLCKTLWKWMFLPQSKIQ